MVPSEGRRDSYLFQAWETRPDQLVSPLLNSENAHDLQKKCQEVFGKNFTIVEGRNIPKSQPIRYRVAILSNRVDPDLQDALMQDGGLERAINVKDNRVPELPEKLTALLEEDLLILIPGGPYSMGKGGSVYDIRNRLLAAQNHAKEKLMDAKVGESVGIIFEVTSGFFTEPRLLCQIIKKTDENPQHNAMQQKVIVSTDESAIDQLVNDLKFS